MLFLGAHRTFSKNYGILVYKESLNNYWKTEITSILSDDFGIKIDIKCKSILLKVYKFTAIKQQTLEWCMSQWWNQENF